jgi:hypothetical protein
MKIIYKEWRIKTHNPYGFVVQRFKPKSKQWKESAYFRTLEQSTRYLFEEQIRVQYNDLEIHLDNVSKTAQQLDGLVFEIEEIGKKLSEACNG